ncbi:HAUS augmin-like complex subunit 6, partial [Eurytemora carolleeae]|uniref:HAUS augmin-like complex subunit 6 n=1 Tax=Eurytemora carolleeae TaxID=1294199 RepID=UPI000C78003F
MSSLRAGNSGDETIFYTNLKLLGFEEKEITLKPDMFEYSNPKGFQQVTHFLLSLLNLERSKSEFRDCWPPLDKKQEAEYRKKVTVWI